VESPCLDNKKLKDDDLKRRIALLSFADGMIWLRLDEYREFIASGPRFQAIPKVMEDTESADENEDEDLITALSSILELIKPFSTIDECLQSGFLMKPSALKEFADGLKKGGKLSGVSKSGVVTRLAFCWYPKSSKDRFDPDSGVIHTMWIMGVRERRAEAMVEGEADE
jgi:hypothetical protein